MSDERGLPGSAWEMWGDAGAAYARDCYAKKISVVPLGEEAYRYASSRGLPHRDVIRRAFCQGYHAENFRLTNQVS